MRVNNQAYTEHVTEMPQAPTLHLRKEYIYLEAYATGTIIRLPKAFDLLRLLDHVFQRVRVWAPPPILLSSIATILAREFQQTNVMLPMGGIRIVRQ